MRKKSNKEEVDINNNKVGGHNKEEIKSMVKAHNMEDSAQVDLGLAVLDHMEDIQVLDLMESHMVLDHTENHI